jgi:DNA-binding transcriptional ArsR family regulator
MNPDDLFSAFSSPLRRTILRLLLDGERNRLGLLDTLGMSPMSLQAGLSFLLNCGLVFHRRDGRNAFYSLDPSRREHVLAAFALSDRLERDEAAARFKQSLEPTSETPEDSR